MRFALCLLPLFATCLALLAGTVSCASSGPRMAPSAPERGIVAIDLRIEDPIGHQSDRARTVYFVRIPEGGTAGLVGTVIPSNFRRGGLVYLLDAEPGTYAAVAASVQKNSKDQRTYFRAPFIEQLTGTVQPGGVAFLGRYVVRATSRWDGVDESQAHYFHLIDKELATSRTLRKLFGKTRAYMETSFADTSGTANFRERAARDLRDTPWASRLGS